ncbi:MAG: hypothetical protein NTV51_00250, partial [Verrucomicrobia bacterium]|nr:hypothetical protein [Verrucomicrobiota bacterium]
MESTNFIRSILPALALVAATVAGWILKPALLKSDRPNGAVPGLVDPSGIQTLDSRLWQDPFVPLRGLKPETIKTNWPQQVGQVREALDTAQRTGEKCCISVGFLSNDRTVNDAESRKRSRLALLAGLGVQGYVPYDSDHLGWLALPWVRKNLAGDAGPGLEQPLLMGIEHLVPANELGFDPKRDYKHVFVLWLDENDFGDHPLARLTQLMDALGRGGNPETNFHLKVFGPRTSTGLVAMCEEASEPATKPRWLTPQPVVLRPKGGAMEMRPADQVADALKPWTILEGMEIYSTWATVSDALLAPYGQQKTPGQERGRPWLSHRLTERNPPETGPTAKKHWAAFYNLTCTDAQLTEALCAELKLRAVPTGKRDTILLLSEWHTDYGRALPLTFAAQSSMEDPAGTLRFADRLRLIQAEPWLAFSEPKEKGLQAEWVKRIIPAPVTKLSFTWGLRKISYLSGVDGQVANPEPAVEKEPGKSAGSMTQRSILPVTDYRPEGTGQLDYVERLAHRLAADAADARDGFRVVAVGVLGSDV